MPAPASLSFIFSLHAPATTEIYTLSLHDALPIFLLRLVLELPEIEPALGDRGERLAVELGEVRHHPFVDAIGEQDRKSTRLNSSHVEISYAVFCLKKKKKLKLSRWTYARTEGNHV